MHTKTVCLLNNLNEYREKLSVYNSSALLMKALDLGEISLTEYIYELTFYYESINRLHDMEKELNETVTELISYR